MGYSAFPGPGHSLCSQSHRGEEHSGPQPPASHTKNTRLRTGIQGCRFPCSAFHLSFSIWDRCTLINYYSEHRDGLEFRLWRGRNSGSVRSSFRDVCISSPLALVENNSSDERGHSIARCLLPLASGRKQPALGSSSLVSASSSTTGSWRGREVG